MYKPFLTISTLGSFSIVDSEGGNCTPRGNKECALIAYVACSATGTCSRSEIGRLLWSDRSEEQRSTSLRRALTNIRQSLGTWGKVLSTGNRDISLDMQYVNLVLTAQDQAETPGSGSSFLESLKIRDKSYQAWRQGYISQNPGAFQQGNTSSLTLSAQDSRITQNNSRESLYIELQCGTSAQSGPLLLDLYDRLVDFLNTTSTYDIYDSLSQSVSTVNRNYGVYNYHIRLASSDSHAGSILQITLVNPVNFRILWTHRLNMGDSSSRARDQRVVEAILLTYDYLSQNLTNTSRSSEISNPGIGAAIGLRGLLLPGTYNIKFMAQSLNRSVELEAGGVNNILKGTIEAFKVGESFDSPDKELLDRAEFHCQTALELEPHNPYVLALGGHIQGYLKKNTSTALELTERSTRFHSSNPFAWAVHSSALMYAGKYELALTAAERAWNYGGHSYGKYFYSTILAEANVCAGRFEISKHYSQLAIEKLPEFRPALDSLFISSVFCNDFEQARKAHKTLLKRNPSLSIETLVSGEYPIRNQSTASLFVDALRRFAAV